MRAQGITSSKAIDAEPRKVSDLEQWGKKHKKVRTSFAGPSTSTAPIAMPDCEDLAQAREDNEENENHDLSQPVIPADTNAVVVDAETDAMPDPSANKKRKAIIDKPPASSKLRRKINKDEESDDDVGDGD
jgi:hypothetical protein